MSSFDKGTMLMPRLRVGELHRLATVRFLPSLAPLRIFFFLQQLLLPLSLYLSLSASLHLSFSARVVACGACMRAQACYFAVYARYANPRRGHKRIEHSPNHE